ncbi:MAG TPA: glutaredoxin family protein [Gammaproteobacteria bacterium]
MKKLELYSRPGCHLCDDLAAELGPCIQGRAVVCVVNIDDDLELKKRYGLRIPILAAGERELSGYPLDVGAVEAFLVGEDS